MNPEKELPADEPEDMPEDMNAETAEAVAQAEQDAMADAARELQAEAEEAELEAESGNQESSDFEAEAAELKDKLLRTMAELENTRRIAAREKADASKYAVANFARDIVRVADNLSMAMMMVTDDARKEDKNLDNLCVGIDMTMKELLNIFESHGIKPVPAEGKPFDHNVHEAVQQVENTEVPHNTVMQVLRGGFTIQDRLLRPAQVIVSTGGAKVREGTQQAYESSAAESPHKVDQET